jgi:hypothetical protein
MEPILLLTGVILAEDKEEVSLCNILLTYILTVDPSYVPTT